VDVGVLLPEGPAVELDIVAIEEVVGDMRRDIWGARELGVSGNVYSTEQNMPAKVIPELAILDGKSQRRHDERYAKQPLHDRERGQMELHMTPKSVCDCGRATGLAMGNEPVTKVSVGE
jgi:hypothetical protein